MRLLVWEGENASMAPSEGGTYSYAGPEQGMWVVRLYVVDPNTSRTVYFELRAPGPSSPE